MKNPFDRKIAMGIAERSFGHTLDCLLGYSDSRYTLKTDVSEFEQNFEEDLEEKNIAITPRRLKIICQCYESLVTKFEVMVRKKYYDKWDKKKLKKAA